MLHVICRQWNFRPYCLQMNAAPNSYMWFDWSVILMLNSCAPKREKYFKSHQGGRGDCKERCSSCVLILTSKRMRMVTILPFWSTAIEHQNHWPIKSHVGIWCCVHLLHRSLQSPRPPWWLLKYLVLFFSRIFPHFHSKIIWVISLKLISSTCSSL
jgi:hypothetical protein